MVIRLPGVAAPARMRVLQAGISAGLARGVGRAELLLNRSLLRAAALLTGFEARASRRSKMRVVLVVAAREARRVVAELGLVMVLKPLAVMGKEYLMASYDGFPRLNILLLELVSILMMIVVIIIVVSILVLRLVTERPISLSRIRTRHVADAILKFSCPIVLHFRLNFFIFVSVTNFDMAI